MPESFDGIRLLLKLFSLEEEAAQLPGGLFVLRAFVLDFWSNLRRTRDEFTSSWCGFHALRRGLATNLRVLGVDDLTISEILRHSDVAVTRASYIKRVDEKSVEAMDRLEVELRKPMKSVGKSRKADAVVRVGWLENLGQSVCVSCCEHPEFSISPVEDNGGYVPSDVLEPRRPDAIVHICKLSHRIEDRTSLCIHPLQVRFLIVHRRLRR